MYYKKQRIKNKRMKNCKNAVALLGVKDDFRS